MREDYVSTKEKRKKTISVSAQKKDNQTRPLSSVPKPLVNIRKNSRRGKNVNIATKIKQIREFK